MPKLGKDTLGSFRTKYLFVENWVGERAQQATGKPLFTIKNKDFDGYPSLKRLYLEMEDITEYEFATKYMPHGYPQWEQLCKSAYFKQEIVQWRKELELKIKARELKAIMDVARSGTKDSFQASRFLVQKGYVDKNAKGRPSNKEIADEANRLAHLERSVDEEYDRLMSDLN